MNADGNTFSSNTYTIAVFMVEGEKISIYTITIFFNYTVKYIYIYLHNEALT